MKKEASTTNTLYCGDNIVVLPLIEKESVDLVYLDPPFLPEQEFNRTQPESRAQAEAFKNFWTWTPYTNALLQRLMTDSAYVDLGKFLKWADEVFSEQKKAYLVNIAARLVECHRVLKPSGLLFFHTCPKTAAETRLLLDQIFPERKGCGYLNEIIWQRTESHNTSRRCGGVHDNIYVYAKGPGYTWNTQWVPLSDENLRKKYRRPKSGGSRITTSDLTNSGRVESNPAWKGYDPKKYNRHWAIPQKVKDRYTEITGKVFPKEADKREILDALFSVDLIRMSSDPTSAPRYVRRIEDAIAQGQAVPDVWTDIPALKYNKRKNWKKTLTAKPEALLARIVKLGSNEGDLVLDAFCGCGPALISSQRLGRRWIGIDIAGELMDQIHEQFVDALSNAVIDYDEVIIPATETEAKRLDSKDHILFQNWVCDMLGAHSTTRRGDSARKDKGIDGVINFVNGSKFGRVLISVKGGRQQPAVKHVRELMGAVEREGADIGVYVTLSPLGASSSIPEEVSSWRRRFVAANGNKFDKLQVITVADLFQGKRIDMPSAGG